MRKIISFVALVLLFAFLNAQPADARSGCCSHHGGVCGCGCCDGSSLSSTCRPYYPECSANRVIIPKSKPRPTVKPQIKKKVVKKAVKKMTKPSPTPTKKPRKKS